jgi:hypothetical protein
LCSYAHFAVGIHNVNKVLVLAMRAKSIAQRRRYTEQETKAETSKSLSLSAIMKAAGASLLVEEHATHCREGICMGAWLAGYAAARVNRTLQLRQ